MFAIKTESIKSYVEALLKHVIKSQKLVNWDLIIYVKLERNASDVLERK